MKRAMTAYVVIAGLAAAVASSSLARTPAEAGAYVAPPLGSTWTEVRHDTGSYGAGSIVTTYRSMERKGGEENGRALVTLRGTTLVNSKGEALALVSQRGKTIVNWDPPIGLSFPLVVGKRWSRPYKVTMLGGRKTFAMDTTWKVEAFEDVTVPAGTFRTFKVSYSDSVGNENTYWFAPELGIYVKQELRRTSKFQDGAGTREIELISQTISR